MAFSDQLLSLLVLVGLVAVLALSVALAVLGLRLRALRRAYAAAVGGTGADDLFSALQRHLDEVAHLRSDVGRVHRNTEHLRGLLSRTVSRVAVVRYDAFDDMGGALSFSAAFLDEHGDGVVVSSINGRTEARTYAKQVIGADSEHHLSPEERAAIDTALSGTQGGAVGSGRRRRRAGLTRGAG
ncbi:MAG TPA: DUF4446 family protein [Nitriliruptorales bacterium]|nr:DUF4446 family protein [Nitriliruptorales bacterium]